MRSKSSPELRIRKKSFDSDGDSSDERNEAIIEDVFEKYSKNGHMSRSQFTLVIEKLSKHIKELKGVEIETVEAAYNLFCSGGQNMSLQEFKKWWSETEKFSYFTGKRSKLLSKAYALYKKYSSVETLKTSTENIKERRMTIQEFLKLLSDLNIETENNGDEFDQIDKDGDGVLSFKEFCAWLNWF